MLMHDPLTYWATRTPNVPMALVDDTVTTYAAAEANVNGLARALLEMDLVSGQRVGIMGSNSVEVLAAIFAASKAGLVPVPINPRLAPPECAYILNHAGARALFVADELTETIDAARSAIDTVEHFVSWGEATSKWTPWEEVVTPGDAPPGLPDIDPAADAYQIYTSGTTGRPKGVVMAHSGIAAINLRWALCGLRVEPGEVFHLSMAATLASGLSQALNTIFDGGTLRLAKFDPPVTAAELDAGVAATALAPTMVHMLLRTPGIEDRGFESLRWVLYGAAPMPVGLLREAIQRFGCDFFQGYGQTEAPAFTMMTPTDHERAMEGDPHLLASVGRVQLGCGLRVLDENDQRVPAHEIGEVCTRGPHVMKGYWNQPDATAATGRSGWHHSGDLGYLDDEGYLYLVDRKAYTIVTGGYNVYPREVEHVLESVAGVAQVAVVGAPDEVWGERVVAAVLLEPGAQVGAEALDERCRVEMAAYKVPKSWFFVDSLPMNANGKIRKDEVARLVGALEPAG
jgi:acyl-CoA synthetase (AMP-forming)/AMP-acid ligase II